MKERTSRLVLKAISLPEDLHFQVKTEARRRRISFGAMAREPIDLALEKRRQNKQAEHPGQEQKFATRNFRVPEDLYRDLKMEAASKRMSLGALIRFRLHESLTRG